MNMFAVLLACVNSGLVVTVTMAQVGVCPAASGDFPNPSSELCTTFFRCIQGLPIVLRCPPNQRFDFIFRFCRSQESIDCPSQLQVLSAPSLLLSDLAGVSTGMLSMSGSGAIGGLEAVSGLGTSLSDRGIISFLHQLDGNNEQTGDNQLNTLLMMSALMNQMNSAKPETSTFFRPVGNLHPADGQTPLNYFRGQGLITNKNYQQMDITGRQNSNIIPNNGLLLESGSHPDNGLLLESGSHPDNGLSLASGSHPDNGLSLGSGRTFIFIPQFDPNTDNLPHGQGHMVSPGPGTNDLGQRAVIQGAKQDHVTFNDPVSSPSPENIEDHSRPGGQSSNGKSSSWPARRFSRRRGQGQRRHLQDNLLPTTDGPAVNIASTSGPGGSSNAVSMSLT